MYLQWLRSSFNTLNLPKAFLLCLLLFFSTSQSAIGSETTEGGSQATAPELGENYSASQVDAIMAGLDDTQVRKMLIDELKKDAQEQTIAAPTEKGTKRLGVRFADKLSQMGKESNETNHRISKLREAITEFVPTLIATFKTIKPEGSSIPWPIYFLLLIAVCVFSLLVEIFFIRRMTKKHFSLDVINLPQMGGPAKFISSFASIIPNIVGIFIFISVSYALFYLFFDTSHGPLRLIYFAIVLVISAIRLTAVISTLICSPKVKEFRIIPMNCEVANALHRFIVLFTSYIYISFVFIVLNRVLGADVKTIVLIQLISATLFVVASILLILVFRKDISFLILNSGDENQNTSWATSVFASMWHIPAILYVFVLWLLLMHDFSKTNHSSDKGAFLLSFMIVPAWLVVNAIAQWIVKSTLKTLHIHQSEYEDDGKEISEEELNRREHGRQTFVKVTNFAKIFVTFAISLWVANLWNVNIPFLSHITEVMFDSLIILALALLFWQFMNSWIERRLLEDTPEEEEGDDDQDEWGGAAKRGRSHTLLPMVRKFVGSVLVVMVVMTILSSMGVNIGPLLAGAGVIGLAVGFGAQKLVSDIFSGFFYLLDDAFRVGEYIEAGGLKGAVEGITLRNVLLRHHLGMLQIVPYSDLGAVTNFMRGGIVVKFNLDFPYDSDIDKIRKIIKKVGQAMLQDEEIGQDFIQPVKSAGVREITNSVMTIRVKFTAQPGTHFVIRREAYKRITEALAAKDIHYAHRKVIVDIPQNLTEVESPEKKQELLNAAGGAAQAVIQQEEEAKKAAEAAAGKK